MIQEHQYMIWNKWKEDLLYFMVAIDKVKVLCNWAVNKPGVEGFILRGGL